MEGNSDKTTKETFRLVSNLEKGWLSVISLYNTFSVVGMFLNPYSFQRDVSIRIRSVVRYVSIIYNCWLGMP